MLERCRGPKKNSRHYEKGVGVCARWDNRNGGSFNNFFDDMGVRPIGFTLSRHGDTGDYEPSNCEWMTNEKNAAAGGIQKGYKYPEGEGRWL
jgi:hypothetical protein